MTIKSESHARARTRTRSRSRRLSACCRHPSEPLTGICASCLRERLSGLDSSCDPELASISTTAAALLGQSECGAADARGRPIVARGNATSASFSALSPDLRRCRSVSAAKCEASCSYLEPRRMSCDVRARNSLADLFDVDDDGIGANGDSRVASKNLGLCRLTGAALIDPREGSRDPEESKTLSTGLRPFMDLDDEDVGEGEFKTMKEFIDLEIKSRNQKSSHVRDIAGNIWEAASVFSKKLLKRRQKQKIKNLGSSNGEGFGGHAYVPPRIGENKRLKFEEIQSESGEYTLGRRSCDTEPRFSVDAARLSVEGGRISFDEPRASWDGYLIARTIPRLAPMLSSVENAILGPGNRAIENHRISIDGQMHSIIEDDSSSGGSAQTNSDSSSSQRRSSFDRSSSVQSFGKKTLKSEGDGPQSQMCPAGINVLKEMKLVITERELKDWHLNSIKDNKFKSSPKCDDLKQFEPISKFPTSIEATENQKGPKKSTRWQKVCNVLNIKHRPRNSRIEKFGESTVDIALYADQGKAAGAEVKEETTGERLVRGRKSFEAIGSNIGLTSIVHARNSFEGIRSNLRSSDAKSPCYTADGGRKEIGLERNKSVKQTSSSFESDMLPFYLMPLKSSRSAGAGKHRLHSFRPVSEDVLN